jgi:hypothetical protein
LKIRIPQIFSFAKHLHLLLFLGWIIFHVGYFYPLKNCWFFEYKKIQSYTRLNVQIYHSTECTCLIFELFCVCIENEQYLGFRLVDIKIEIRCQLELLHTSIRLAVEQRKLWRLLVENFQRQFDNIKNLVHR